MYFRDIIGQEEIKEHLRQSAKSDIVPHAQLFVGAAGVGTFPLALAYARYLNCTNRTDEDACGHCPSCLKYDMLAHPDLHFVFPMVKIEKRKKEICDDYLKEWREFLDNNYYFTIDDWLIKMDAGNSQAIIYTQESDEITRKTSLRIAEAKYRILFIWMPERMHLTCANKLLKIIEEPPQNTIILMVSEQPNQILGTILSRSQRLNIPSISHNDIKAALMTNFKLSNEDADNVAHLSGGNYLKAIEAITTNEENQFYLEQFIAMMRNAWTRNVKVMKDMSETMASLGRERQKNFLDYSQHLIRENFMYRFQSPDMTYMSIKESTFASKFSPFVNERNVYDFMNELNKAKKDISQNVNAKMVFFDLSLKLAVLVKQ